MASEENAVQRACLEYLSLKRVPHWRSNQIPSQTASGQYRRFVGRKGAPDIQGLLPGSGRWLGVECKSAKGRQSPEQKEFQAMVEAAGGVYVLARSVDDVRRVIERVLTS